jgi:HEAT repeat protein
VALFGKPDSLTTLLRKVQQEEFRSTEELEIWLARISAHLDLKPKQVVWMVGHRRREVREFGRRKLVQFDEKGLVDLLLRQMEGKTESIRQEIAELAISINPRRVYRNLGRLLHSRLLDNRLGALQLIASHPEWREYLGHLKAALKDPENRVRYRAVEILCRAPEDPTISLVLRNLIFDDDEVIRRQVIEVLAARADADLVEPFLERLPFEAPREQAHIVRALTRLARDPSARLEDRLLPMLADENQMVRESAIKLLREIPNRTQVIRAYLHYSRGVAYWLRDRSYKTFLRISRDIIEPVLELMEDDDPDIRVGAMLLAADTDDPRVIPVLRRILTGQDDWWVRVIAVDTLARFQSPEVLDLLIKQLADPELRFAVVAALGRLKNSKAVSPLVQCLGDRQHTIRMAVLDALAELHFPEVADAVSRVALDDEEPEVREKALLILEQLGAVGSHRLEQVKEVQDEKDQEHEEQLEATLELEMENPNL